MRLVYSVRNAEDVIYASELGRDAELTYSRRAPEGWTGHTGRIDAGLIGDPGLGDAGLAFICGSNPFVEAARCCCSTWACTPAGSAPSGSGRPADAVGSGPRAGSSAG